jgi:glycosyltransferase involved in cell wall biosynthesis
MPLRLIVNYGRELSLEPQQDLPRAGIQTGLLGLCSALARRGHEVHLFGPCCNPGRYDGVFFHGRGELARFAADHPVDVLLVVPEVLPLLLPVRARARVVWSLNAFKAGDCALAVPWSWAPGIGPGGETARLYPLSLLHPYADRIVVGSRWQARYLAETSGIPGGKFTVAYLGVSLEYYRGPAPGRHRHRLVYTSQARRGLEVLLRLFPRVRAAVPEAELHIFGAEYRCEGVPSHLQEALPGATGPGVFWRGALGKSALAHELRSAAVMAYPCTFKETFCLAVAEAQAAGLPVVTSDRAALAERVTDGVDGFLMPGRPGKPPGYEEAFVQAVVRLLREDDLWERMGTEAAAKARRLYDGEAIAAGWEQELTNLARGREPLPPPLDPALDLLDPRLLAVTEGEASARVPPALAGQWLRQAWASYGYDPRRIPGLPPE